MKTNKLAALLGMTLLLVAAGVSSEYHDPSDIPHDAVLITNEPAALPGPTGPNDKILPFFKDQVKRVCELGDGANQVGPLTFRQYRCNAIELPPVDTKLQRGNLLRDSLSGNMNGILI